MEKNILKFRACIYLLGIVSFLTTTSFLSAKPTRLENQCNKIYIDSSELDIEHDSFHIHLGNNVWIETNTVNRDATGLFTYESDILISRKNGHEIEAERTWKCPYCYRYWPIGTACQNKECPSRYK